MKSGLVDRSIEDICEFHKIFKMFLLGGVTIILVFIGLAFSFEQNMSFKEQEGKVLERIEKRQISNIFNESFQSVSPAPMNMEKQGDWKQLYFLFLMGLESTGHHMLNLIFRELRKQVSKQELVLPEVQQSYQTKTKRPKIYVDDSDPLEFALILCWIYGQYELSPTSYDWSLLWNQPLKLKSYMQTHGTNDTCKLIPIILHDMYVNPKYHDGDTIVIAPVLSYPFLRPKPQMIPDINMLNEWIIRTNPGFTTLKLL
ncbi:hypothetical protein RFI_09938, partial [Reticulomyxa filosa]